MATTTQILFNSPALHSLKRDQLVKLCKIHGIKANGKNVDLIQKLQVHAQQLPPEAATIEYQDESNAEDQHTDAPNDNDDISMSDADFDDLPMPRPSEQWEVVMEDIEEVDETAIGTMSSMNTLRSRGTAGEFGSKSSKKTMTSSIKSIATSLGIKRSHSSKSIKATTPATADELAQHAIPYSSLPPPTSLPSTDHLKLSTPDVTMASPNDSLNEPIPGSPSRPGAPVPSNARLSTGEGLTTTIRLITSPFDFDNMMSPPKLQPMQPSFDLIMSPGPTGNGQPIWPASPSNNRQSLYPALPLDDLPSLNAIVASAAASPAKFIKPSNPTQDVFSPQKPSAPPSTKKGPAGRLSLPQNQPFLFGSPLPQPRLSNKDFGAAAASVLDEMNKRLEEAGVQKVDAALLNKDGSSGDVFGSSAIPTLPKPTGERFAQAHDDAFSKMDSIANHYAARRPAASKKRKSDALGHGPAPSAKRKSTVAGHTGQRVISNGVRKNMTLPGGFGDEDFTDVEDESNNEEEDAGDRRASKRIRVVENQDITKGKRVSLLPAPPGQTEQDRERADRRKSRDRDAMKKRLDANKARRRSSRGRQSIGKVPPPKPSRFGFLSSAKNLVRNVWNMGAGGSKANNATSNIPKPSTLTKQPPPPAKPPITKPPFTTGVGLGHPTSKPNAQTARVRSTSSTSTTTSHLQAKTAPLGSARTRSPIPSFAPTANNIGDKRVVSGGQSSIAASKRPSVVPRKVSSGAGHMRKDSNSSVGSRAISPIVPKRPSGASTLLAPTASSLAKMKSAVHPGTSNTTSTTSPRTLQSILNTPLKSPRPTKIFSRPLGDLGSPTTMPTPNKDNSLGAAASALMGGTAKPALPPKPQSLAARRPRVSRTRVIAKLGAQRAAAAASSSQTSSAPSVLKSPTSGRKRDSAGGRMRSSMGSSRRSLGVVKNGGTRVPSGGEVMMSAKKKARQSEYMRRRSGVRAARVSLAVAGASAANKRMSLGNTPLKNAFAGGVGAGAMDIGDD